MMVTNIINKVGMNNFVNSFILKLLLISVDFTYKKIIFNIKNQNNGTKYQGLISIVINIKTFIKNKL